MKIKNISRTVLSIDLVGETSIHLAPREVKEITNDQALSPQVQKHITRKRLKVVS